jgi:hypothetical protein
MMFDPARHEPVCETAWDEGAARAMVARIVAGAEDEFAPGSGWRIHPMDQKNPAPVSGLYFGDCGMIWALEYLQRRGAAKLRRDYREHLLQLEITGEHGSYMFGETPILLMHGNADDRLAALVEATMHHPARELMWGAPGTMLAALFMHRRTGAQRWADLYRRTARTLHGEMLYSEAEQCWYWDQDLYGHNSTYIDAVHGFVATAAVLLAGRHLLDPVDAADWQVRIAQTIRATAEVGNGMANWRAQLRSPAGGPKLVQYCHGAPGFVICLAEFPDDTLDDLLLAGGEMTWRAGPLRKGSNLCHGTGGNGYAFLKLFRRTGDEHWLHRARAFAMHSIAQCEAALAEHGQWRNSLWTGDMGLAIYLLDCIEGGDRFPTLDVFH